MFRKASFFHYLVIVSQDCVGFYFHVFYDVLVDIYADIRCVYYD